VVRLPHYMPAIEIARQTHLALTAPRPLVEGSGLKVFDLPFDYLPLESVLYWRRENAEDPALTWLRGLIADIAVIG
jgi:DNA-binding transcriptional LysR family regulator